VFIRSCLVRVGIKGNAVFKGNRYEILGAPGSNQEQDESKILGASHEKRSLNRESVSSGSSRLCGIIALLSSDL
jgi:hypothetical protein